ncbi:MAG: tRNA (adenosine(37)-N6)-dimethylallyltransferase MiaA [Acidobacteriota bacterium]|nr:tRNA (adenosine(37)-N6)-dimethylallyltransferase MiaA [Acidobacteriota bacterium]
MKSPAVAVVGPTASGKSRLGIVLARAFQGEIVGCDALHVYRQMDIGTAKVTLKEREGVPHHMLDIAEPDREFSAGDYQRQARTALREISGRGRLPIVAGGSGFYLRALIDGLFEGPERSGELRARMRSIILRKGPDILHRLLERADPESAARIAPNDADRIIRACEIYLVSGKNMSWWQSQPRDVLTGYRWLKIGIDMPRELLYQRINLRVERMFENGLLDETRRLIDAYPAACPAFKAIGYRQAAEHLAGRVTLTQAIESTQMESRRYAKRQLTWFRADGEIIWLRAESGFETDALDEQAQNAVRDFI